jgi:hypothetical protein
LNFGQKTAGLSLGKSATFNHLLLLFIFDRKIIGPYLSIHPNGLSDGIPSLGFFVCFRALFTWIVSHPMIPG